MRRSFLACASSLCLVVAACGEEKTGGGDSLVLRSDVTAIRSTREARSGVFIPPYLDCRDPVAGETATREDGKVCTHVSIAGATEPGRAFADYADCAVVRTQRPYWSAPPAAVPSQDDPRVQDAAFMAELAWVTEEIRATGCTCCHDSSASDDGAAQWDISLEPIWTDSISDTGVALFTGLADSSVLGAYPPAENNGFQRDITGIPSTDAQRMRAFFLNELERRGISEEQAAAVPPFGGPIYANQVAVPGPCEPGVGVDADGSVRWTGAPARYVYVLADNSDNPGVPPNFDVPEGTLWRLDVLASEAPIASGFTYGTTPRGSFQYVPETSNAPALVPGTRYQLSVLLDVGLPIENCFFEFGASIDTPDASTPDSGTGNPAECVAQANEIDFGTACTDNVSHSECGCPTNYCAVLPGQTEGYCTLTGCVENPDICPEGWSCFDLSAIVPGQPSFCLQP